MSNATPLDPIDPTLIAPGLVAIPLTPTPWDDCEDGQHAVTDEGIVYQRREGLWYADPWWQNPDRDELLAICDDPDGWALNLGWTRKQLEEAKGLTPIELPAISHQLMTNKAIDAPSPEVWPEAKVQATRMAVDDDAVARVRSYMEMCRRSDETRHAVDPGNASGADLARAKAVIAAFLDVDWQAGA